MTLQGYLEATPLAGLIPVSPQTACMINQPVAHVFVACIFLLMCGREEDLHDLPDYSIVQLAPLLPSPGYRAQEQRWSQAAA